jgi:peptidoglycan-associated lipoprotein
MEEQLKLTRSQWFKVVVALAVVLAVSACGKKKAAPPPPPPPPSAPAPTASLTANPNALNAGQATTLIWKTDYATSVTIDQLGKVDPAVRARSRRRSRQPITCWRRTIPARRKPRPE